MLTASKMFKWEMAHMLEGHEGLCKNIHGHSYKMEVKVSHCMGATCSGPSRGMVTDFSDLKRIVTEKLINDLDHALFIDVSTPVDSVEQIILASVGDRIKTFRSAFRPTAENMSMCFFRVLQGAFEAELPNVRLESVKIWETDTAYAEYDPSK